MILALTIGVLVAGGTYLLTFLNDILSTSGYRLFKNRGSGINFIYNRILFIEISCKIPLPIFICKNYQSKRCLNTVRSDIQRIC